MNEYNENGIKVFKNFISNDIIKDLREECKKLFSYTNILGPGFSTRLSKYVKEIPYPTNKINSVNLLEVAIDIHNEIENLGHHNMKLANVALYFENNNNNELIWHSDLRNGGLIRAQIVIEGGSKNSGAFRYMKGSHNFKEINQHPSLELLKEQEENIITCDYENGSMFLINTVGYHSKCICEKTRISLMFDFLPEEYILNNPDDVSSNIYLSSSKLTEKVIQNIYLFKNGVNHNSKSPNTADYYQFYKPFGNSSFIDFLNVFITVIKKKFKK